jgi:RimJ/RimL family protein N-acetyltransferase
MTREAQQDDSPFVDSRRRRLVLTDGTSLLARPIEPDDAPRLQRFHRRLSQRSIYLRHFGAVPELSDRLAAYFTNLDEIDRQALVAIDPLASDEIVAVVRYDREPDTDRAEYAALVEDRWQGRGVGLGLTRWLIERAREQGIRVLYALVLPDNLAMLRLLQALELPSQIRREDGVERVEIQIDPPGADARVPGKVG